ncbi:MAG: RNA polymerase sigma factor [Filifactoraceae bacterium]
MLFYLSLIETEEDKRKFEKLYISYKQTMFYVAVKILKDEHIAEDAVHHAFLKIINNLDKIDIVDNYKTKGFVVVITENTAIDIYRKRKREKSISFDEIEIFMEDSKIEVMAENMIKEAMNKLPINYMTVLKLKYTQGFSDSEISNMLDISEDNVRQRISRAKRKLSQILNESEAMSV